MKQFEITDAPDITQENFANLFNVYNMNNEDYSDTYTYSINKGLYFKNIENLAPNSFTFYTCKERDQWSTISYTFYGTIELWWLICKANEIVDPVTYSPIPGEQIKLINNDLVPGILQQLRTS